MGSVGAARRVRSSRPAAVTTTFSSCTRNRQSIPASAIHRRVASTRRRYSSGGNSHPCWAGGCASLPPPLRAAPTSAARGRSLPCVVHRSALPLRPSNPNATVSASPHPTTGELRESLPHDPGAAPMAPQPASTRGSARSFDLVIHAGRVVCPATGLDGPGAVALAGGRIAAAGPASTGRPARCSACRARPPARPGGPPCPSRPRRIAVRRRPRPPPPALRDDDRARPGRGRRSEPRRYQATS